LPFPRHSPNPSYDNVVIPINDYNIRGYADIRAMINKVELKGENMDIVGLKIPTTR
jgi:hypothetical protein